MGHPHGFMDFVSGRKRPTLGSMMAVCPKCDRKMYITQASWARKTRPMCPACGTILVPSKDAQKRTPELRCNASRLKKRACVRCNAQLASGNSADMCRPCLAKGKGVYVTPEEEVRGANRWR